MRIKKVVPSLVSTRTCLIIISIFCPPCSASMSFTPFPPKYIGPKMTSLGNELACNVYNTPTDTHTAQTLTHATHRHSPPPPHNNIPER
eukprot:scaffold96133_cov74-Attheya_sp.AAC.2